MNESSPLKLAVVGAGPVGLALALHAANALADAEITVFDARPADKDVSGDPRTLALSLGSVQLLERVGAWRADSAQPIAEVHVSQQAPSLAAAFTDRFGEPALAIRARDEGVPLLGAVLSYGAIVAPLQATWQAAGGARAEAPLQPLRRERRGAEERRRAGRGRGRCRHRRALRSRRRRRGRRVRERGEEGDRREPPQPGAAPRLRADGWVGVATFAAAAPGTANDVAYERFTRHGPAALLPLKDGRAGLVWCVDSADDPVRELSDAQRVAVLNTIFHPRTPRLAAVSPLKAFPLGLLAERTLVDGRTVRIGNAAQTLHPVAGQGLNLGMRDAFELVRALARERDVDAVLRKLEWQRAPDRWAMIAATDFLARSFTWTLPGAAAARGLGLFALQALGPVKSAIARQMMFGSR
jgi:2-octaprenyl-6-methoxyphenol hydroxylase